MLSVLAIIAALAVPEGAFRVDRVDAHRAAFFLAETYKVNVIVAGGTPEPLTLALTADKAEAAFQQLAKAAGLALAVEGRTFILAPAERVAALGKPRSAPGGRKVTIEFMRVDAARATEVIAEIDQAPLAAKLTGQVSLHLRNVPAQDVLGLLTRLAGAGAAFPTGIEAADEGCVRNEADSSAGELSCVPTSTLEVAATSVVGKDRAMALLRRRGAVAGTRLIALVRPRSRVGEPMAIVESIDTDGVVLKDGTRLLLGGGDVRTCTVEKLRAFTPPGTGAKYETLAPETFEWVDPKAIVLETVRCQDQETDAQCEARARRETVPVHTNHRVVSTTAESDLDGVVARLQLNDGKVINWYGRDVRAAEELVSESKGQPGQLKLLGVEPNRVRRRIIVKLQDEKGYSEQRTRERLAVEWRPDAGAVEALSAARDLAEGAGLYARPAPPQADGGTVRLVIGCP